ncbi:MAG: cysteine desulfurase NifS [Candidatus Kerfeldbacteria bacterium CG15_BIG_FIL_POST_REV_8_21_14_020_45_12]|uniref:Cysteine desulfurase NifS n=1 Tax=Candidatus Kerfeldbacteria bacterium CG15_BIG_FIL_POST_REV_8_21_14_020_45_12 TaxID=2014247 RepID=A0A2M7H3U9_9BACT|nr:MAG: cysteine desulfurase NifS [Candidatus Kerfeldbacteria bacterium CG15_BIG_FIL_POST_REV_8_21_14_020_45_12]PJA93008.1 MAG: cysteine desulfurase NifS [Candidatus Kerfeldbacteria bacterium CG_4_9_14_3_um_filter_45_8]
MNTVSKEIIYLDHAATTPVREEVAAAMLSWQAVEFGNPSSQYSLGYSARQALDDARAQVAAALGCSPQEVVFTGGGTESANLAVLGSARFIGQGSVVTTAIEHAAVLDSCQQLEREGFTRKIVKVPKNGIVDAHSVAAMVDESTVLVSVMLANNEIGTIQPVSKIVQAVKAKNPKTLVHTDACQATGSLSINVDELGVDLLTLNSSKIYGPKGVGALYVKRGVKLQPLMFGGDQEQSLRPGTENVSGIVGFGLAVELAVAERETESERLSKLRDELIDELIQKIPGAELNGAREPRLPNNINIFFPNIDGEALLVYLNQAGVAASLGSACAAGSLDPSHVLLALGYSKADARRSLRLTLGRATTSQQIDRVIKIVVDIINKVTQ